MAEEGNDPASLTLHHWVDARYQGQSFELRVPWKGWKDAFHSAHEERYGYARPDTPLEAVTLRAVAEAPPLSLYPQPLCPGQRGGRGRAGHGLHAGNEIQVRRVWRKDLLSGQTLQGPAIVLEYSSTTWLPPGWKLEVDTWGSLLLSRE